MKKAAAILLSLILALPVLSACQSQNTSEAKEVLTILSLQDYWDREIFDIFEQETGIQVLIEEAATPEIMHTKYQTGTTKYDLFCSADYQIEQWIEAGSLLEIDRSGMEYIDNIDEKYWEFSQTFDPENKYSIPHFWGTVGILYNESMVLEEVTSFSILWDEAYSNQIIMQNSMRDSFVPALKLLNYSLNTQDKAEWEAAKDLLIEQKPLVQSYLVDEARTMMEGGNAAIALVYSGEAFLAREANEDLVYVVPEEGSNVWVDSWCIPDSCTNPEAALKFLDFLCREDIAMMNFEYTYYATPNKAVFEALDQEIQNDEAIFPSEEIISKCETMKGFNEEMTEYVSSLWKEIKGN